MKIGFIGLGRMGEAIALRLREAGHDLAVYNRTAGKAAALEAAGATVAGSPAEAAQGREVVFTCLADDASLAEICDQVIDAMEAGAIHVATGTHGIDATKAMAAAHAKAGLAYIAAPVIGRFTIVAEGKLIVVAAGPKAALETCTPLFEAMGKRTFLAGEAPEAAASIKLANNFVLGCAIEVMGEGFSLVRGFGVEPKVFHEVLTEGVFNCPAYAGYGDIIAQEDYGRVGITAVLGLKDAMLALKAAQSVGVVLPSGEVWRERLEGAIEHGDGDKDWAVVALEQARKSGLS
ncbi:MAG TPA: NAD(P)-dependent oxidoreductase [Alphaproteobacteria bacterium]|nr:NAD(P)-dependent oxidoreductase [Alphaproteobacteria bacterium]